jgi:hypothetical protein
MVAALVFRLDDQRPAPRRNFGPYACAGDSAAYDHDIPVSHLMAGYELESRTV